MSRDTIIYTNAIVDKVLERFAGQLGTDYSAYRNHVMRCLNYYALLTDAPVSDEAALAWAVHDLGIWTAGTFDYLEPSAQLAAELAPEFGIADTHRAEELVLGHHQVLPFGARDLESFRRADLIDVSHGILRHGLSGKDIRAIVRVFPYAGFHRFLATGLLGHAVRHPLRPLPMLRLR